MTLKKTPLAKATENMDAIAKDASSPPHRDEEATKMVCQAVVDYIQTLPPAARASTELYFRQVLPRIVVTPP